MSPCENLCENEMGPILDGIGPWVKLKTLLCALLGSRPDGNQDGLGRPTPAIFSTVAEDLD